MSIDLAAELPGMRTMIQLAISKHPERPRVQRMLAAGAQITAHPKGDGITRLKLGFTSGVNPDEMADMRARALGVKRTAAFAYDPESDGTSMLLIDARDDLLRLPPDEWMSVDAEAE